MTRSICRLQWGEPIPGATEADKARVNSWLIPVRLNSLGALDFGVNPGELLRTLPEHTFSLELQTPLPLSPSQERKAGELVRHWVLHQQTLRISGRPLLWNHSPERLNHPHFAEQRQRQIIGAELLVLGGGPPGTPHLNGMYERSDRIRCRQLPDDSSDYESFLFHPHHRPSNTHKLVVQGLLEVILNASPPLVSSPAA